MADHLVDAQAYTFRIPPIIQRCRYCAVLNREVMNEGVYLFSGHSGADVRGHHIQGVDDQPSGHSYAFYLLGCFDGKSVPFRIGWIGTWFRCGLAQAAAFVFFPAPARTRGVAADFYRIVSVFHSQIPRFVLAYSPFVSYMYMYYN